MSYFLFIKIDILKVVIQLSGHFVYADDYAGDQTVWINEVQLYMNGGVLKISAVRLYPKV
jgi:hypothetical protein